MKGKSVQKIWITWIKLYQNCQGLLQIASFSLFIYFDLVVGIKYSFSHIRKQQKYRVRCFRINYQKPSRKCLFKLERALRKWVNRTSNQQLILHWACIYGQFINIFHFFFVALQVQILANPIFIYCSRSLN